MSTSLGTVLLCVVVGIFARCDCGVVKPGITLPKETSSTTLRLTAQRNDTGSWTTRFGDYQMTIEHKHFDAPKGNHDDDGTWTMKVKHTSTVYEDETDRIPDPDIEALDQLATALSDIIDNSNTLTDEQATIQPVQDATTTEEPFIAGIQVDEESTLPGNEQIPGFVEEAVPYYRGMEEIRDDISDDNQNTSDEREKLLAAEENRVIMERFPRSRSLAHTKGYEYHYGVGWVKLNTSHWQWPDARKACEEDGGHLAIPDTMQKISVFRQILKNNANVLKRAVLKNQAFVGVYDPDKSRKLTTVLGELYQPENDSVWFQDEPNNANPGEECITLHLEGKMRDVPCFYTLPFLCQID